MTSSVHTNSHISRRASIAATAPYTIPGKVSPEKGPQHSHQHHQHHHHHHHSGSSSHGHAQKELSSSVPLLSREFVVRRISEGETGRLKEELKCEACGKGYKHISSLAKHLWEHTPEWNVTKKLLISKHQQVQLLEAASILISMNEKDEDGIKFNPQYRDKHHDSPPVQSTVPLKQSRMPSISNESTYVLPKLDEVASPKMGGDDQLHSDTREDEDDSVFGNME